MDLNSRNKRVHLIFNDVLDAASYKRVASKLDEWLSNNAEFYAYIYHSNDTKEENGKIVPKTPHIHCVCELKKSEGGQYQRAKTIITSLSDALGIKESFITISKVSDMVGNCRYLLHLDSLEKHLYDRQDVNTNDCVIYDNYIQSQSDKLSTETLYKVVIDNDFKLFAIMSALGVENYRKYRLVIQDICKAAFRTLE